MYIVEHFHTRRYWIEGEGWSTTDESKATRYSRAEADALAHRAYGTAVEANSRGWRALRSATGPTFS
jgi:hypothetical protein